MLAVALKTPLTVQMDDVSIYMMFIYSISLSFMSRIVILLDSTAGKSLGSRCTHTR